MRRSFPISGAVLVDDGTPPPVRASIDSVCPTRTRTETYTNSRGEFHFNLGGQTDVLQDASVNNSFPGFGQRQNEIDAPSAIPATTPGVQSGSMSQQDAIQCFLRASAPGYSSERVSLGMLQMTGTTTLPPIVLHRMGTTGRESMVSVTTLQAPPAAKNFYDHARKEIGKGQTLKAIEDLRKAIQAYPAYSEAMVQLGEIYAQQGLFEEAERMFDASISADPKFAPAYFDLAPIAGERQNWSRMAQLSETGLQLDSSYAAGNYFNALANYRLGDYEKAESRARQARVLDPGHTLPYVELLLADVFVRRNQPAEAIEQLRTFLKFSPDTPQAGRAREMLSRLDAASQAARTTTPVKP